MSKKDELRLLRRQYSIDAPVNAHGRTGESSNVGSMLDLYAHSESAEEILLQRDDEKARKRFEKGFSAYLEHVFTEEERELIRAVLARETSVYTTQDILRAEYIERMEWIQRKAYKNVKPLIALARKTGWSGATEFIKDIYERLKQLSAGADMTDVIPQNKREKAIREKRYQYFLNWVRKNKERRREIARLSSRRVFLRGIEKKESESRMQMYAAFEDLSGKLIAWIEAKAAGKDKSDLTYLALDDVHIKVTSCFTKWNKYRERLRRYRRKRGMIDG